MSQTLSTLSRYSLLLSGDREHREAAQRLRYDVFAAEPGFAIDAPDGLDADRFDEFCEHLLVLDNATDAVVGSYRILIPDAARRAGDLYTATEFDLDALGGLRPEMVELGRACVHPDHRNGTVLAMMWAGVFDFIELSGYRWVVGCVSVPMRPAPGDVDGALVRAIRDRLLAEHASAYRVRPWRPVPGLDEITAAPNAVMPPLLRGYLRLGARVCGEPAHDPEFRVADFPTLLDVRDADPRLLRRLRSASGAMRATR